MVSGHESLDLIVVEPRSKVLEVGNTANAPNPQRFGVLPTSGTLTN